jgi:uncharacterized radical SAM protein YgiQ
MDRREMDALGWKELDVLLVSGDAYVDHPSFGAAVIGRLLLDAGYKVGIVAQPDWKNPDSVKALGRPRLGCGVTAGNMDSMPRLTRVGRRFRRGRLLRAGGKAGLKPTCTRRSSTRSFSRRLPGIPVVLGGNEAEPAPRRPLRLLAGQDAASILVDTKADILVYGMGERATLEIFKRLEKGETLDGVRGTARFLGGKAAAEFKVDESCLELPSYEEVLADKMNLMKQTIAVEHEMNPWNARRLLQRYAQRALLLEPPAEPLSTAEFDRVCEFPYAGRPHPTYKEPIPAFETIKASIPVVRGCPGGCAFCGLVSHQGRFLSSRSEDSVAKDVEKLLSRKGFTGTISDIGGAAGNIYGHGPKDPDLCKRCKRVSCIVPDPCPNYKADGSKLLKLLRRLRKMNGVKHVFKNSGIRLDLAPCSPN